MTSHLIKDSNLLAYQDLSLDNQLPIEQETLSPVDIYVADKAKSSTRAIRSIANIIANLFGYTSYLYLPWHLLRFQHVKSVVGGLQKDTANYSPKTINAYISVLRGVSSTCFNLGIMTSDDCLRIKNVKMVKGSREKSGRSLSLEDIESMIDACTSDKTPLGSRDLLIVGLLYICGLRRAEVTSLTMDSLNLKGLEGKVIGKGNKERSIYFDQGLLLAIREWLAFRGDQEGPLLCRILKGGKIIEKSLSDQAIYDVVRKRQLQAGIEHITPHDLRRTFITDLLSNGVDVLIAQRLAGHGDPKTTAGYDLRSKLAEKEGASKLTFPIDK